MPVSLSGASPSLGVVLGTPNTDDPGFTLPSQGFFQEAVMEGEAGGEKWVQSSQCHTIHHFTSQGGGVSHSASKRKETLTPAAAGMDLHDTMLSAKSQTQEGKRRVTPLL